MIILEDLHAADEPSLHMLGFVATQLARTPILIIGLVVLGPGKLPDVAQSLGRSVREFRKAATDISDAGKLDAPPPSEQASPHAPPVAGPAAAHDAAPAADAETPPVRTAPPPPSADDDAEPAPAAAGSPARDPNLS